MPPKPRRLLLTTLFFAFIILTLLVAAPRLTPRDLSLLNRIHAHATPTLTAIARTSSAIGSPYTVWPLAILIAITLWLRRPRRPSYLLALTMAAAGVLENLIKLVAQRPRPTVPWAYFHENTYSFPSGHATLAVALYGILTWVVYRTPHTPWQRATALTLAITLIPAIGLSRLYLGAHHPTDVLAGYLTGALTLTLAIVADLAL